MHFVGGLGPLVSGVLVTALAADGSALARLYGRMIEGGIWIIIAILIPALLFAFSALLVAHLYQAPLDWRVVGSSTEAAGLPRPMFWLANLGCYGYGEEVGWRGFALPRLQRSRSALEASLLLTVGWATWHIPLFAFSSGFSNMGAAATVGWLFSLALGSVLMTWLFNSSSGSIAAVAFFHAALDIFMTSAVAPELPNVMGALLTIGTLLLIPIAGPRNLARRPRVTEPVALPK